MQQRSETPEVLATELHALGLTSGAAKPSFAVLSSTLIQELDPNFTGHSDDSIAPALKSLGFLGPSTDEQAILDFLFPSVRAHRILQHAAYQRRPIPPKEDTELADALSRLHLALSVPPVHPPSTPADVAKAISALSEAARSSFSGRDPTGSYLLSDEDCNALKGKDEKYLKVLAELNRDYALRVEMLLHRLRVTVQAFSRGHGGGDGVFDSVLDSVERDAAANGDMSGFEVFAARDWMLEEGVVDSGDAGGVKSVIMGGVPDRGGRVGMGTAGEMPGFRDRVEPVNSERQGASRRKGKGGKRRKGKFAGLGD